MIVFNENQIYLLRGSYTVIARSCGVTGKYVKLILSGERNHRTEKAKRVVEKAKAVLQIINE